MLRFIRIILVLNNVIIILNFVMKVYASAALIRLVGFVNLKYNNYKKIDNIKLKCQVYNGIHFSI